MPHHPDDDRQPQNVSAIDVLAVASEIYPLVKTGGLGDVVGALPAALAAEGIWVRTLVPGYPPVMSALESAAEVATEVARRRLAL